MKDITVLKFGGSLIKNDIVKKKFFKNLATLSLKKQKFVLVHGGGPEINNWINRIGLKVRFVDGLRFTDAETFEIVEMVLSAKINKYIVRELLKKGVNAVGISGVDGAILNCKVINKLGFVGEPIKINNKLIRILLDNEYLPVLSSIGVDSDYNGLNINADSAAMALAVGLKAKRLILFTDVPGVLDSNKNTIPLILGKEIPLLIKKGIVSGGMIPKIKACLDAIKKGVKEVWIAEGTGDLNNISGTLIKNE